MMTISIYVSKRKGILKIKNNNNAQNMRRKSLQSFQSQN